MLSQSQKEVDEGVVTAADTYIRGLEADIQTLLPNTEPLTAKLLVVFWALSL